MNSIFDALIYLGAFTCAALVGYALLAAVAVGVTEAALGLARLF